MSLTSHTKKIVIQYMSDLHLEFAPYKFIPNTKADCLVLAGDIINQDLKKENNFTNFFTDIKQWGKPAFYVLGNHEYYFSSFPETVNYIKNLELKIPNLIVLNNSTYNYNGVKFIGSTLWSEVRSNQEWYISRYMNDYNLIKDFDVKKSTQEHLLAKEFLDKELDENIPKVVITHHLPSEKSINIKYKNSPLNSAFASNLDDLITKYSPYIWIHGHSHSNCDYKINKTRIVSNTRGYCVNNKIENYYFRDDAIVEFEYPVEETITEQNSSKETCYDDLSINISSQKK